MEADLDAVEVPTQHWEQVGRMNRADVCRRSQAIVIDDRLTLAVMGRPVTVDLERRCLVPEDPADWPECLMPLLTLLTLVYLRDARDIALTGELVAPRQLAQGHFFQGPHSLRLKSLDARFAHRLEAFWAAGERLGGTPVPQGDVAFRLWPFPRIPLVLVFWDADDEFPARISTRFDRSIEGHLQADAIWGLVHLTGARVLHAGGCPEPPVRL